MPPVSVTHFSDPGCPWAYSASPAFALLRWRFGEQLQWRHVMIGLTEHRDVYRARGYTRERSATMRLRYRVYGMPFGGGPKADLVGTARMCRAVIATRLAAPERAYAVFRALQFGHFTTAQQTDEDDALLALLQSVPGLDAAAVVAALDDDAVTAAYEADKALARSATGSPTEAMGRSASYGGPVRYTAPSLLFKTADGRRFDAGGFQTWEVYDTALANLEPGLERRPAPDSPLAVLEAFPDGLTTAEVALVLAPPLSLPDRRAAEAALIELAVAGSVRRVTLGDDALWQLASAPAWLPLPEPGALVPATS